MPFVEDQLRIEDVRQIVVKAALDEKEGTLLAVISIRAKMEPFEIGALLNYVKRSSISAIQVESRQMALPMRDEGVEQQPLPDSQGVEMDAAVDAAVAFGLADATLSLVRTMDQPEPQKSRPPKKHVDMETGEIGEEVA